MIFKYPPNENPLVEYLIFSSRIKLKQKKYSNYMLIKKYYLIYQVFKLKRKQNTISASIIIIKESDCTNTKS